LPAAVARKGWKAQNTSIAHRIPVIALVFIVVSFVRVRCISNFAGDFSGVQAEG
jgi:hypothetical protein